MNNRFGSRAERRKADEVLGALALHQIDQVKLWVTKNPASPDRDRVLDAAIVSFPHHWAELQKLAGGQSS